LQTIRKLSCGCWRTCRDDSVLVHAFTNQEDIHTRTAAEVFKVDPLMVTPEMRRSAKAVNFGIVYGQTPFGLAQTLCIDRKEADLYIRRYFERYSGVREFIDRTIAEVRQTGVSKTLLGRRRPIPDMQSRNPAARSFAERTAVNTPLQGTAADLIKVAMIGIAKKRNCARACFCRSTMNSSSRLLRKSSTTSKIS
jgi:DNA polymerase-1